MRRRFGWYRQHATGCWLVLAVLLGSLQAVYFRYSMNPDGIAYLDMGDAYLRGDWTTAIRSHWSPLYAWLLAAALRLAQPPAEIEFPVMHLVNLAIYGAALGAFSFLLREILATVGEVDASMPAHIGPPDWAWLSFGYAAFSWCTLHYTPLGLLTPDLLVSALVYAICGIMLRLSRQPRRNWSVVLGVLLGLGYLAKAPMLALALVFLAVSTLVLGDRVSRIRHLVGASVTLGVVAVPFIVLLSVANGRPTAGDSAFLNYLWVVDGAPKVHWQGGPDGLGQPIHHSQQLSTKPTIFAFDSPFAATYSAWYAPEYWFKGATPVFRPLGQLRAIGDGLQVYAGVAVDLGGAFAALTILLSMHSGLRRVRGAPALVLLVPALAALGMYALVLVEGRYVAPFVVVLLLGLLMLVRLPQASWSATLTANVCIVMVTVLLLQIAWITAGPARAMLAQIVRGRLLEPDDQARVARALRSAGIGAGDPVASGNRAFNDYWARLAHVRITAEVSEPDDAAILEADPAARITTQRLLLAQDVRAVVAHAWPARMGDSGWRPIDGSDYFYYLVGDRSRAENAT